MDATFGVKTEAEEYLNSLKETNAIDQEPNEIQTQHQYNSVT